MMRAINPCNLTSFMAAYRPALEKAMTDYPGDYGFSPSHAPMIADKMETAFAAGTYNHDGRAIRAACKSLGIKTTRTAIEAYLVGA